MNNSSRGSFIAFVDCEEHGHLAFLLVGEGAVELQLMYERRGPPFDNEQKRRDWVRRLNTIPGVHIDEKSLKGLPKIPLKALATDDAFERFSQAMDWAISEMHHSPAS